VPNVDVASSNLVIRSTHGHTRDTAAVDPGRAAAVLTLAVLTLTACTTEKDPGPSTPSPAPPATTSTARS